MSSRGCHGADSAGGGMPCCCGRSGCAYLEHNTKLISGLERDLDRAARLGQALLSRHEFFVAKAQEDNERLSATIAELQSSRDELLTANERMVAENRELVAQLDATHASYKSSDAAVKSLEEQLRCSELEVGRLTTRARRVEELEACVHDLDLERSKLQGRLDEAQAESRTTLVRWRESERKIKQLERELDKIEWESKVQRERHEETVAQLEHERVVDRELGDAQARLKGAAAVHEIDTGATNSQVVSSFVRDILKDNAALQAGIVELRELLQSSNDEVQNLRQQVMNHQPLGDSIPEEQMADSLPLDPPLGWHSPSLPMPATPMKPEVHVHHHYHGRPQPRRDRTPNQSKGRPVRRRSALHSATTPRSSAPSTPRMAPLRQLSSPDPDLTLPPTTHHASARSNRWSAYSSVASKSTISSMSSSPRSAFDRRGSIFDRIDPSEESSRPTSPESAAGFPSSYPDSEAWIGLKERRREYFNPGVDATQMAPSSPIAEDTEGERRSREPESAQTPPHTATTSGGEAPPPPPLPPDQAIDHPPDDVPALQEPDLGSQLPAIRPLLRPCRSQDSLVSISGMDIHIAKRKAPSRTTALLWNGANSEHFAILPSSARSISASQPVAGITDVTATSSSQKAPLAPSTQGPAGLRLQSIASAGTTKEAHPQNRGLGRFGGWMRSRWGTAPMASTAGWRSSSAPLASTSTPPLTTQPSQDPAASTGPLPRVRQPGINQPGAIPGFWPVPKVQHQVTPTFVDADALKVVLEES